MSLIRIDRLLSFALKIPRQDAKALIKKGIISVDGIVISKADAKIEEDALVKKGDEKVEYKKHIYILLNKPSGILSASSDPRAKTVVDILPEDLKRKGLSPVGRLDKDTTGLLILTDDGDFIHRVISPKSGIEKKYLVELDGMLTDDMADAFREGITLASGEECKSAKLEIIDTCSAIVTICEGKYHQIKRMFGVLGLGVNRLHRIQVGGLALPSDLKPGEARELISSELALVE